MKIRRAPVMTQSHKNLPTERTALLQAAAAKAKACSEVEYRHVNLKNRELELPSPLELPRSRRCGILLGVWIANFLSVRLTLFAITLDTT